MKSKASETYDVTDAFIAEAKPLWEQLHDLSKKYNVPLVVAACVANNDKAYSSFGCVHLNGQERTPPAFAIAAQFLHGGMGDGLMMVKGCIIHDMIDAMGEDKPDDDSDTAGGFVEAQEEQQAAPAAGERLH